jgi:hypothetical protein
MPRRRRLGRRREHSWPTQSRAIDLVPYMRTQRSPRQTRRNSTIGLRRAFTWSELEDDLDLSRIGREALALFREHGWSEGLVVPVSRGGSRFGLVSVAGVAARLTKPEKSALCLMCEYLLSRIRALGAPQDFMVRPLGLTGSRLPSALRAQQRTNMLKAPGGA